MNKSVIIVGYSGHAYVICDIFRSISMQIAGYCETEEKALNPFNLTYLGSERHVEMLQRKMNADFFTAIGDNMRRKEVYAFLNSKGLRSTNAIHSSAILAEKIKMGDGIMIGPGVIVNPLTEIGNGVICNSGSVVEHECSLADFVHIAPGAVLCGNVNVGEGSFVGANAVVKQGITIGKNVLIGAGSVVVKNVPDNSKVWGNPSEKRR